ncbi:hypothetical protein [Flavisolibacter ginsenosidimutans]|uniref:Uncharacterized protein n=1 Tax=Flavisolibacter ginsenosidimutans TaxID=661481 RepID=A0A5B8UK96_9BACT|nr:hypothetical protein [Flavisolibacter ginsenosidimutans]QEC56440.1 hypothetical protein FSB75_11225 [Flavisolibacter ginsenosidimutans]
MYRWLQSRGRRHSKKDYTKDSSVAWFVVLLVLLAAYLIVRTLTANHANTENESLKEKKVTLVQGEHPLA